MPESIADQIKRKDYAAQATAARQGSAAAALIRPLAADPDREVRLLALACLDIAGGTDVIDPALESIKDRDEQVRSAAVMILLNHPPKGRERDLLLAFIANRDPFVKSRLAMTAGRLPSTSPRKEWEAQLPLNTDPEVRHGLNLALARMGNQQMRDNFLAQLAAARGPDARPLLIDAQYLDDRWLLPVLSTLLDHTERAQDVMPDDGQNRFLRTCDLAAGVVLAITRAKVPFAHPRATPFTADELREIKRLAAAPPARP